MEGGRNHYSTHISGYIQISKQNITKLQFSDQNIRFKQVKLKRYASIAARYIS